MPTQNMCNAITNLIEVSTYTIIEQPILHVFSKRYTNKEDHVYQIHQHVSKKAKHVNGFDTQVEIVVAQEMNLALIFKDSNGDGKAFIDTKVRELMKVITSFLDKKRIERCVKEVRKSSSCAPED